MWFESFHKNTIKIQQRSNTFQLLKTITVIEWMESNNVNQFHKFTLGNFCQ